MEELGFDAIGDGPRSFAIPSPDTRRKIEAMNREIAIASWARYIEANEEIESQFYPFYL
jgi:hypothetical protein